MKLVIPLPRHDETITSVLDRAACAYATTREDFAEELVGRASRSPVSLAGTDLDTRPPRHLAEALAQALGVSTDRIMRLRIPASAWLLDPSARTAYCPSCFAEDSRAAGSVYMRRAWAYSFMTHCPRHKRPLVASVQPRWRHGEGLTRDLSADPVMGDAGLGRLIQPNWGQYSAATRTEWARLAPPIHILWARLCRFEGSLLRACLHRPYAFDRRSAFYRDIVVLFSGNWLGCDAYPSVNELTPHALTHLILFAHLTAYPPDKDIREVWQQFLRRAHPRWRRTFMWILMQCVYREAPFDISWIYDTTNRNSGTLEKTPRARWFSICFHHLPDRGRQLAKVFAAQWPTQYQQMVEKLLAHVPYIDLQTQNELHVTAWKHSSQLSRINIESAALGLSPALGLLKRNGVL